MEKFGPKDLQELVATSHEKHYGVTSLAERLRDIQNEVAEIVHHRDEGNLREEIGDAGWSLLQLCNERGIDFAEAVTATMEKLDKRANGLKVALIGTSANPITNAHLILAMEIQALTDVDQVWFYLVGEHPWGKKLMPAEHRLEMVRRAIMKYPKMRACDFEMVHGRRIYEMGYRETAQILEHHFLPAHRGYQFSWVMGSDVAQTFHEWKGCRWMADTMTMTVVHRVGYDFDKASSLLSDDRHRYLKDNIATSNISSSLVRERGKTYEKEKIVSLVPDVVWDYLVEHKLLDPDVMK